MRTVRFGGARWLVVEHSGPAAVLSHPATGDRVVVPAAAVAAVPAAPPLVTAARGTDPDDALLARVPDTQALGLLAELDRRGPTPVRRLLADGLCESDLHGLLAELTAADLVEPTTVAGERAYRLPADVAARL